jgi:hypothetical protein
MASAPGLLFSSRDVLASLEKGPGNNIGELERLQRLVTLQTGSPELRYSLVVECGPASLPADASRVVRFGLEILGDALEIRDGYAILDWNGGAGACCVTKVPSGYYSVEIEWVKSSERGHMPLFIWLNQSTVTIPGSGGDLIYGAGGR